MGLFGKDIYVERRTTAVPYEKTVNITEKRAPTDESIRIYEDMLEKAAKKVLYAEKIQNNVLTGIVVLMSEGMCGIRCAGKFTLNGKEYRIDVDELSATTIDEMTTKERKRFMLTSAEKVKIAIYKRMAEVIASKLMDTLP